jgi:hypothetical protein
MNMKRLGTIHAAGGLMALAAAAHAQNGADLCAQATAIIGERTVAFDLGAGDADGLPHAGCDAIDPQTWRDVWWRWTATCDGVARVTTCGLTTVDTEIVVYALGGPCPPTDDYIVACADDACGEQAQVEFLAQAGQEYLVRLGRDNGAAGVTGSIAFECVGEAFCEGSDCREGINGGLHSHPTGTRIADRWVAPADGVIESICVIGQQAGGNPQPPGAERFRVVYYADVNGRPGPALAWFAHGAQARVTQEELGPGSSGWTRYRTAIRHAPVAVQAGQTIWIEVFNETPFMPWSWAWSSAGPGVARDPAPNDSTWADATIFPGGMVRCVGFDAAPCAGDVNGDGAVNFGDLNGVLSMFNAPCP